MLSLIANWDQSILLWLNAFAFSWVDYFLAWPTFLGDSLFLLPIVLVFLFIWDKCEKIGMHFTQILLAVMGAGLVTRLLKIIIQRDRPYSFFYEAIDQGEVIVNYLFRMDTSQSFPSGHATAVFAVAFALNYLFQHRLKYLYFIAFWIAITRVYVAAHFPSDVIVGAFIGCLISWFVMRFTPWEFLLLQINKLKR